VRFDPARVTEKMTRFAP
jgi:hypothetical protein